MKRAYREKSLNTRGRHFPVIWGEQAYLIENSDQEVFFLLEFLKGKNCTVFITKVQSVEDYTEPCTLRKPQYLPNAFVLNMWTSPPGATVVFTVFSLSHRDTVIGARPEVCT